MNRFLHTLAAAASFAALASAQCGTLAAPGTLITAGDDTLFATAIPLGFPFTMAGSAGSTTWTHFKVCTNGWIALCDSTGTLTNAPGSTSYGATTAAAAASLYGPAGSNPRIAPYWGDLYANTSVSASAGVYVDNTTAPGVSCTVTWVNVYDYTTTVALQTLKSFQAKINASGTIEFTYGSGMNFVTGGSKYVGISASNGAAVETASNFAPGPNGPSVGPSMHEVFSTVGSLDLGGKTITFVPSGTTWSESVTCAVFAAANTTYGSGCYVISDSVYQFLANAAVASTSLTGQSLTFTPAGSQYAMSWGGGTYVAPTGGAVNVFASATDDGESSVTPSIPFPTPAGPQATVRVHSNGVISWGAAAQTFPGTNSWVPAVSSFLGAGNAAFWSWHDFNESEAGSGRIKREEVVVGSDTILYVTWDNVENYSSPVVVNPSTMQFQLNLTTGACTIVWQAVDNQVTSADGTQYLVGWSPAGASNNGGSVNLATALPLVTTALNLAPMSLAASPAPVSTPSTGTLLTYTQSNIPEAVPTSGVYFGITILSIGQDLPGTDLGFLGMPGCSLHVASLDATIAFVGGTNSQPTQFQIPAGVPYGFQLFAQSAAIIAANSLPNGQNAFGATLSNGVASFISFF